MARIVLCIVPVVLASGCSLFFPGPYASTVGSSPSATRGKIEPENWGRFQGEVKTSWSDDGRHMVLLEPFSYIDPRGKSWTAPAGAKIDGASIPGALWSVVGGPFEGKYRKASVVHDYYCSQPYQASWEDVHLMFHDACRCEGLSERDAKMMYYAVFNFGPRWAAELVQGGLVSPASRPRIPGSPTASLPRSFSSDSASASPASIGPEQQRKWIEQARQWINDKNPPLHEIEAFRPAE